MDAIASLDQENLYRSESCPRSSKIDISEISQINIRTLLSGKIDEPIELKGKKNSVEIIEKFIINDSTSFFI